MDWLEITEADKSIYIYGAGNYGEKVLNYLLLSCKRERIRGIFVTDISSNRKEIQGIPILRYEKHNELLRNSILILAMGRKAVEDVLLNLSSDHKEVAYIVTKEDVTILDDLIYEECCKRPIKANRVYFSCFDGRGYTCNCKYISEELRKKRSNSDIVWELSSETCDKIAYFIRGVRIGSLEYYLNYYTSKVLVFNSGRNIEMKKREGQYIIDTWHGIGPTKKMGIETKSDKENLEIKNLFAEIYAGVDLMTAASDLCERNYRQAFLYKGEIIKSGYPRNDIFFRPNKEEFGLLIRKKIGIKLNELMVLYAPTYRYEQRHSGELKNMKQQYVLHWDVIKKALESRFGSLSRLVYRFHHVTDRGLNIHDVYPEGIDATDYPDMQELLLAADILITDYSSSMWDFSLQRKPVFLFYNDADEVEKEVGFYRHPDTYPYPKGHTTEELCEAIESFDDVSYQKSLDEWFAEYGTYDDGHASERVVAKIIDVMEQSESYGAQGQDI